MAIDYPSVISDESARIVDGYEHDRSAAVPWSDRWTVGTVARHVSGTQHVVAGIIRGRPEADFGLFEQLDAPPKDSPEFVGWFRAGTDALLDQLATVPAGDECWCWYPNGRTVGWWARRLALEAVVHRADTDLARGVEFVVAPEIAADGVDEYLDVFVDATRSGHGSPSGPTVSFQCTDDPGRWWLDLSGTGARVVSRHPLPASTEIRGTACDLLMALWGRTPIVGTPGLEVSGDLAPLARWPELLPSI